MKKLGWLAILFSCLAAQELFAQSPEMSAARAVASRAVVAATYVPYCLDMVWQVPLGGRGGRVGWLTASAANPDPLQADAQVFLLRGTGTVFSPGFGEICTMLRRAGMWAEDLGPAGDGWVCQHLIRERQAGRPQVPIVLIGHSRGARHVVDAARELQKAGIEVHLLVCLDVTLPPTVPDNVRHALNVYMSQHRIYPADPLKPASGSAVRIENVDLSDPDAPIAGRGLHHLNITASRAVQEFVVERILQVVREGEDDKIRR